MNFLFWNVNRKDLDEPIAEVAIERDVDLIILAESPPASVSLLTALNQGQDRKFSVPFSPSERILFLSRLPLNSMAPVSDGDGVSIQSLRGPLGPEILVVAAHLRSKLHAEELDQTLASTRIRETIEEAEDRVGHARSLIIGDLNMNPFEQGVVAADALNAVMDQRVAKSEARTVNGKSRRFLFNPMWSRLGDASEGPPGTYYRSASGQVSYFWYTFDQVLLRPSLLPYYSPDGLEVISAIRGKSLLTKHGRPNKVRFSDHLPILVNLSLERSLDDE